MLIKFLPRDDAFQVCSRANSASGHARSDAASYSGETSRPATGARPPVGSHMRGGAILPRNSIPLGAAPHGAPIGRGVPIQEMTPHYSTSYDRELAAWVFIGLCAAMPFAICAVCFGIIKLFS